MVKHLGRIPAIIHTDHANIARLEALPLPRVDAKHFRWCSELLQGGSRLLHRPGAGALHRGLDAISRHPEGRDKLILARASEWKRHRAAIRGVQESILQGEFDDDEPVMVDVSSLPQEDLEPVPYDVLEAASVYAEDRPGRRPNRHDAAGSSQGPGGGDGGGVPSPSPDPARSLLAAVSPGAKFRVLFLGPWAQLNTSRR